MRKRPSFFPFQKRQSKFEYYSDLVFWVFDKYPREYFVIAFFVFYAFAIITKTFGYTVLDHDKYSEMAEKQQTAKQVIEVDRGTIYSSWSWENSVLAVSVDLDDLAIDPAAPWNKAKLASFLTDVVYKETCEYKSKKDCYNNMLAFLKVRKLDSFSSREDAVKSVLKEKVKEMVFKDKVTSTLISSGLTENQLFALEKKNIAWIYIYLSNLYVNPEEIVDENFVASELSKVTWKSVEDIKYAIRKRELRYSKIYSKLSISTSEYIKSEISKEKEDIRKWIISTDEAFSTFIILESDASRYYPEKYLWAQISWFFDASKVGRYWIEWYFNDLLKWKEWITNFKAWTSWFMVDISNIEEKESAIAGADIKLTIDRNIQDEVENIIWHWVEKYNAVKGSIIVMDPKTWNIVAMANYPSYDPNNYGDVYELEKINPEDYNNIAFQFRGIQVFVRDKIDWEKHVYKWRYLYLREATEEELLNDAIPKYKYKNNIGPAAYRNDIIEYLYEPGSVFKPLIAAMWFDSGDFSKDDMYEDKWFVQIDNFKITNVSDKCKGYNSYQNAMNYSCNTWMVNMIEKVWKAMVYDYLDSFGFWKPSWISLAWEVSGKLIPYENWSRASLFTRSYGRWMVTTQLKMAVAYSIMANGWVYYEPNVLKEIDFWDWRVVKYEPNKSHRVISESASTEITAMLLDWVENWVAKNWRVLGYKIAWKTWTAGYVKNWVYEGAKDNDTLWRTVASFAGYWPVEDPKFVVVVRLDRPKTNQYGWQTSAFLFSETAKFLFDYYKIPMTRDPQEQLDNDKKDIEIKN